MVATMQYPTSSLVVSVSTLLVDAVLAKAPVAVCPMPGAEFYDSVNETLKEFFECPGPDDPPEFTRCCDEKCCELRHIGSVMGLDITITIALCLSVIITCVILGITIVICCFWSPCPLYDTCGGGYKRREGIPFGEFDSRDTDPLTLPYPVHRNGGGSSKYYTTAKVDSKLAKPDHV